MPGIKVCMECMRINPPDAEACLDCGSENFQGILFLAPFYDSEEGYSKGEDHQETED